MLAKTASLFTAIRPKTLPASLGPIAVALSLAYSVTHSFDMGILLSSLSTFLSLQIAANLFNDALDFKNGVDTSLRIGFKRVTQAGIFSIKQVLALGFLFLVLSFLAAAPLIEKGGVSILWIFFFAASTSYLYTGGPYPLSYYGLGEVFVFIFYGFVAVLSLYFIETKGIDASSVLAALQIGLFVTVINAINNMRDIALDGKMGKWTLAVGMGDKFKHVIAFLILSPYGLGLFWIFLGEPLSFVLPLLLLPFSLSFLKKIYKTPPSPLYNRYLVEAGLMQLLFAVLLSLSFIFNP